MFLRISFINAVLHIHIYEIGSYSFYWVFGRAAAPICGVRGSPDRKKTHTQLGYSINLLITIQKYTKININKNTEQKYSFVSKFSLQNIEN